MLKNNKIIPCTVPEKERIKRYLRFVVFFNKFINHKKKIHRLFIARDMKM